MNNFRQKPVSTVEAKRYREAMKVPYETYVINVQERKPSFNAAVSII
jgi:hypothetical protein